MTDSEISAQCNPLVIGKSESTKQVIKLIKKVKDCDVPVLILGESGTGKDLVARCIHYHGARKEGNFVALNCGAIPDNLLESELFGHARGAFTGSIRNKSGLIEEADEGTFFMDEIGDLSQHLQAKLLRLLQDKEVRRIGENKTRIVDARFISATNKNLEEEIQEGAFREDLYYRLKIITIRLAPLRERKEDIVFLFDFFVDLYCEELNCQRPQFSSGCIELLVNYLWPGNVRELQNEIKRCLILNDGSGLIREKDLSPKIHRQKKYPCESSHDLFTAKAEFEKRFLNQALLNYNFHRTKTATELGISRQGLFKLIKKHNIEIP
jgi:transcriptional regulator with PAS, ATPase and Fis domain